MAEIQFAQGVAEEVIPDVRLTRAKDGSTLINPRPSWKKDLR